MTDKNEIRAPNKSWRSLFGSSSRYIIFLTLALVFICQTSLAVDDQGSEGPGCIATLFPINTNRENWLKETQSSILTAVTLGQVKAKLNRRNSVYVRIVREEGLSQFGVLKFIPNGGILQKFAGNLLYYSSSDRISEIEVFDTAVDAVMAAARSALENGKPGFIGFVRTDEQIELVSGEIQSVGGEGIHVLEVSGEVRKIDPARLYWDFKESRFLKMGLWKGIALYRYIELALGSDSIVNVSFKHENGGITEVAGRLKSVTSLRKKFSISSHVHTSLDGYFRDLEKISVILQPGEAHDLWVIPLTKIIKFIGPLFKLNETSE